MPLVVWLEITVFKNSVDSNIHIQNGNIAAYFDGCKILDAGGSGFWRNHNSGSLFLHSCIVANNTNYGVYYSSSAYAHECYNTIFYNNGSDGFAANNLATNARIGGCMFSGNGGYGFNSINTFAVDSPMFQNNAFYSNASGKTNNVSVDSTNLTLTADPFVDAAGGDFNLNATNGGGAVLRSTSINLGS